MKIMKVLDKMLLQYLSCEKNIGVEKIEKNTIISLHKLYKIKNNYTFKKKLFIHTIFAISLFLGRVPEAFVCFFPPRNILD